MKLSMGKQKSIDGFTFIELLIVLMMFVMLLALFPLTKLATHGMRFSMDRLKYQLLQIQQIAIQEGRDIEVTFGHNQLYFDEKAIFVDLLCDHDIVFHPNGNVNQAMTLHCYQGQEQMELVIGLGSGRMYVK